MHIPSTTCADKLVPDFLLIALHPIFRLGCIVIELSLVCCAECIGPRVTPVCCGFFDLICQIGSNSQLLLIYNSTATDPRSSGTGLRGLSLIDMSSQSSLSSSVPGLVPGQISPHRSHPWSYQSHVAVAESVPSLCFKQSAYETPI